MKKYLKMSCRWWGWDFYSNDNCTFDTNYAQNNYYGNAIYNLGTITEIKDSYITNN